jgi:hypothetical protein
VGVCKATEPWTGQLPESNVPVLPRHAAGVGDRDGDPRHVPQPGIEKQMEALNAANIAKMVNRSAPGSAQSPVLAQSSSSYFGGNSLLHQSNSNMMGPNLTIPSPSNQHLQSSSLSDFSAHSTQQQGGSSGLHIFQQNMNVQPPNSMPIPTPISAGQQTGGAPPSKVHPW